VYSNHDLKLNKTIGNQYKLKKKIFSKNLRSEGTNYKRKKLKQNITYIEK